jgi:hypothetical protein
MLDHFEVYTHEEKGVKKPTKILYMGRQITESDLKAIMEHVARVHLESMKSFRTGMKAEMSKEDLLERNNLWTVRQSMQRRKNGYSKPDVQQTANFPETVDPNSRNKAYT